MADEPKIPRTRASDPGDLSRLGIVLVWGQRLAPVIIIGFMWLGFRLVTPRETYGELQGQMVVHDSINRAQDIRLMRIEQETERNMARIEQKVDVLIRFRCRDLPPAERSTYLFCD